MRILLDTHVLLWAIGDSRKLSETNREFLTCPENEVYFSAANIWGIVIKNALEKADFQVNVEEITLISSESGFLELPITAIHARRVATLPSIH